MLRSSSGSFGVSDWSDADLYRLAALPKLRRWASNWVRLLLSLCGPSLLWISDRSVFRRAFPTVSCPQCLHARWTSMLRLDFLERVPIYMSASSSRSACSSLWLAAPRLRLLVFRHGIGTLTLVQVGAMHPAKHCRSE